MHDALQEKQWARKAMPRSRGGSAIRQTDRNPCKVLERSISGAITKGYLKQVRFLVEFGANVNERDSDRKTPLMHCALIDDEEWAIGIARNLIEHGARSGLVDTRGLNSLQYACIYERPRLVQIYLGAIDFDLNHSDKLGNTALHYAVSTGNVWTTRLVMNALKRYKYNIDRPNSKGVTPLIQAWKRGQIECARILIEEGEADETVVDSEEGKSAQEWEHEALEKARAEQCKLAEERKMSTRTLRRTRAQSAPTRRNAFVTQRRETTTVDVVDLVSKEHISERLYRPASATNVRNQPEQMLNVTPAQCFEAEDLNKSGAHSRRPTMTAEEEETPTTWRGQFKKLLSTYDFQFSNSYRKSVSEALMMRVSSPNPSEEVPSDFSDIASYASLCSRVSKAASIRRGSVLSKTSEKRGRLNSAKPKRSSSFLSVAMAAIPDT